MAIRAGRVLRVCAALATAAALALASLTDAPSPDGGAPSPAGASRAPTLALPAPTGPHPVGLRTLALRDASRADPWEPRRARELMVSLWYPALPSRAPRTRYVTAAESRIILRRHRVHGVPGHLLNGVRTHAGTGAPPLPATGGGHPLVLLSPGFTLPRSSLTALAEDLASRGYAAAAVDHAYEAVPISYPDGRITGCRACRPHPDGAEVAAVRAADLSFVRRRLTASRPPAVGVPRLDPARTAVAGHSIGGAAALRAMLADSRFAAGANLDGTFQPGPSPPLDRPFLLLGADRHGRPGADATWTRVWRRLDGRRHWLSVAGAGHGSFTDYALLAERLGRADPGARLPAGRGTRITRELVAAFLDRHLRNRPAPLLDGPSSRHPEVRRHGR